MLDPAARQQGRRERIPEGAGEVRRVLGRVEALEGEPPPARLTSRTSRGSIVCNHDLRASPGTLSVSTLDEPAHSARTAASTAFCVDVSVSTDGENHVVNVSGELDVRTRQLVEQACLTGHDLAVVVEMSELTFMDCCGYAGLVAIRRALLERGGSLTLTNQVGQPARLLALLGAAESARHAEHNGATMP